MMLLLALLAFPLPVEGTRGFHAIGLIPFGEGVAALGRGGSSLLVLDGELQPVLDMSAEELDVSWFSSIAADPFQGDLWVLTEDAGPFLFRFDRQDLQPVDGFRFDRVSNIVVDGAGRIWYSSGGELFRDFAELGIPMATNRLAVSADGGYVAWVDDEDRVWSSMVADFRPRLVEERRSLTPFYLPTSPVLVVPLLEDGFTMHMPDGSVTEIDHGQQPFWCPVPEGVVYCVSLDDGHSIIESDLYVAAIEGDTYILTDTPECLETSPSVYDGGVIAVDAGNGSLVVVPDDLLFGLEGD